MNWSYNLKISKRECSQNKSLHGLKNGGRHHFISKHGLANIRVHWTCICWIQIHSRHCSWIVISCSWVSINAWKAVFGWQIVCTHYCVQSLIVACHHVSIVYSSELARIHRSITGSVTIVIWDYIGTAVPSCTLTSWSADWACCTVRAAGTICCRYCGKVGLVRTVVCIENQPIVAGVSLRVVCSSRVNIYSHISSWIVVRNCRGPICTWQTLLTR